MRTNSRIAAILVLALALQPLALMAQTKLPKPGFNFFSKEQDVQLGREASAQIEKEVPVIRNAEMEKWLEKLAAPLISQEEAGGYPYQFRWVNDDNINAFALPGGPIYMNTGLLRHADNEAQVVGVLAHEISHVALRHGTNQASKANLFSLPAMLGGAILGRNGSMLGQLAQLGIGLGLNGVLMKYSRGAETQSDQLGAYLMHNAGYNPLEMANFFEKLEAEVGNRSGVASWFSSHPNPGNRVQNVQKEILTYGRKDYNRNTGEFQKMRTLAAKLPAPAKQPQQGGGQGGTATIPELSSMEPPSKNPKTYQATGFQVNYPDNWQLSQSQEGQGATILPSYGTVSTGNGGSAIGYGAIANLHTSNGSQRFEEVSESVKATILQNNPGTQMTEEGRRIQVNGQRAMLYMLNGPSPFQGQKEVIVLAVVERSQNDAVSLIFVAPERDYSRFEPTFKNMLSSLRIRQ